MNPIAIRNITRNPLQSMQVNPARNWQINPARNWLIDPVRNMQVDPRRNIIIDPTRAFNIPGYYICSVADSICYYFTVRSQIQNVHLVFDANRNFVFLAVGMLDCYAIFSKSDYGYVGTLCPNGAGRYNWFSLNGEWQYFFT